MSKPGRNDPCPCGSGKKYKKCCYTKDVEDRASKQDDDALARLRPAAAVEEAPVMPPWVIARIAEDRLTGRRRERDPDLVRAMRDRWTISRVAELSTDAIVAQLAAYGVSFDRDRFVAEAARHRSAWSLGSAWEREGNIHSPDKRVDFFGLAACELWKRFLPERPSCEMLDDQMQEGYEASARRDFVAACERWGGVWATLRTWLGPDHRTMASAASVFSGRQSLFNWLQDYEMELAAAGARDPRFLEVRQALCEEWLAQFTEDDERLQIQFRRALGESLIEQGQHERGLGVLRDIVARWPANPYGYVAIADELTMGDAGSPRSLPRDPAGARRWLEEGLARAGEHDDVGVLSERLAELESPAHVKQRSSQP